MSLLTRNSCFLVDRWIYCVFCNSLPIFADVGMYGVFALINMTHSSNSYMCLRCLYENVKFYTLEWTGLVKKMKRWVCSETLKLKYLRHSINTLIYVYILWSWYFKHKMHSITCVCCFVKFSKTEPNQVFLNLWLHDYSLEVICCIVYHFFGSANIWKLNLKQLVLWLSLHMINF